MWTFVPAQQIVSQFLATFVESPPSQRSPTLSIDKAPNEVAYQNHN